MFLSGDMSIPPSSSLPSGSLPFPGSDPFPGFLVLHLVPRDRDREGLRRRTMSRIPIGIETIRILISCLHPGCMFPGNSMIVQGFEP